MRNQHASFRGFLIALRSDLYVHAHSHAARVTILLPALAALLQLLVVWLVDAGTETGRTLTGGGGGFADETAWGYYVDALLTGLTLMNLALITFAAWSLASERDNGTIRHLLIRGCGRGAMVVARLVTVHLIGLLALLLLLAVATPLAGLLWNFGPVMEDGYELISRTEIHQEFSAGIQLALLPQPAAIAFALLVAVAARGGAQAMTLALGLTLAIDVLKDFLGQGATLLYATHQPSLIDQSYLGDVSRLVRGYSDVLLDPEVLSRNQWLPLPQALLLLLIALVIVRWSRF